MTISIDVCVQISDLTLISLESDHKMYVHLVRKKVLSQYLWTESGQSHQNH